MKSLIRNRSSKRGFTLIELMIVVAIIGILAVLAIYGVSRYLKTSKTAEATNNIGMMSKQAAEALTREKMSGTWVAAGANVAGAHGFCLSAASPVPAVPPPAAKYVSKKSDWDTLTPDPTIGFYCLKFSVDAPQYYSYNYQATGTGLTPGDTIVMSATGDLNGDGAIFSNFKMTGKIEAGGALTMAPKIEETLPEE